MSLLDEIANPKVGRPLAAFLVGRENRRQRIRQENIDAQNQRVQEQQGELRGLQIDRIRNEPARLKAEQDAQLAEQQRQGAIIISAIDSDPNIDPQKANTLKRLVAAGNHEAAVKVLTASGGSEGFTLADGAQRFDANGNLIATNEKNPSDSQSAAEEKIARLVDIGFTPDQASRVADGAAKVETDPSGGVVRYIDIQKAMNGDADAVIELPIQPAGGAREFPDVPRDQTLFEQKAEATGPINVVQNAVSKVLGAVGGPIDDKTVAATQFFSAAENTVIRAFSLNPRYPVAEQNRIKENIKITPKFFDSAELMGIRMKSIDQFLAQEQELAEFFANEAGADRKARAADRQTANAIKRFRSQLGVPGEAESGFKIISRRPANAQ